MKTLKSQYLGQLSTAVIHLKSGQELNSDAPVDNNGKGQSFSPTDLVAAALGSCMVTVMGIFANKTGFDLKALHWDTTKVMTSNPRKISEIEINFYGPKPEATEEQLEKLKTIALNCPVALSLHPDVRQKINFNF